MADERLKESNYDDEDFSGSFTEDDFNSTDLFGEDIHSDEYHLEPDTAENFDFERKKTTRLTGSSSEHDYTLDEDSEYTGLKANQSLPLEHLKKLAIPAGIGTIVLVIIIYLMTHLFGSRNETATSSSTAIAPIESKTIKENTPAQRNSSPQEIELPPLVVAKTTNDVQQSQLQLTKIQEALGVLQVDIKNASEKADNNLENTMSDVQDLQKQAIQNAESIQALTNQLNSLNNKVDEIGTGLEKMIQIIKQATTNTENPRRNHSMPSAYQQAETGNLPEQVLPAYYVQAIIPGRAWLKDAQGKVISVGIGDQIPGFGTVTQIQPRAGTVHTSDGITIEYGISQY